MRYLEGMQEPWGTVLLRPEMPVMRILENAVYIPYTQGGVLFGLFDSEGVLVEESLDRTGTKRTPHRIKEEWKVDGHDIRETIEEDVMYVGLVNGHFGHWLLNSLPRFWPLLDAKWRGMKLIGHGNFGNPKAPALSFINYTLRPLGTLLEDVHLPKTPVRLRRVFVPAPSFHEQLAVHSVYGEMCAAIGRTYWSDEDKNGDRRTLYVSKAQAPKCWQRMSIEALMEDEARKRGFHVIHPEAMTIPDQIRTISRHRMIAGSAGSFFHLIPFAAPGRRAVALCSNTHINSNYLLVDALSDVHARYYAIKAPYVKSVRHERGPTAIVHEVNKPKRVTREFLNRVEGIPGLIRRRLTPRSLGLDRPLGFALKWILGLIGSTLPTLRSEMNVREREAHAVNRDRG